jgi:hypothetical protein
LGDVFDQFKREIDEELRQERYEKLWRKYGRYVIAAAGALVLGVAGATVWKEHRNSARIADEVRFSAAKRLVEEGRAADAAAMFAAIAADADTSYATLARFHQAALRAEAGDAEGAAAIYRGLADDSAVSQPLRDLATILLALRRLDEASGDEAADLVRRLERLAQGAGAWRHSADELLGLFAVKAGDPAKAKEHFARIVDDPAAPPGARGRAAQLLSALGA